MSRRRQQYRFNNLTQYQTRKSVQTQCVASLQQPEPKQLTFRQACRQLWKVIKFKILPSKYLNKKVRYKRHWHNIDAETADFFFIRAYPNEAFPKEGNKYKIR